MKYYTFGRSGLRVSELCLGTMTFGDEKGTFGASRAESKKIFDTFVNEGGNFIDTANVYQQGRSEKYLGAFIKQNREEFVLATKYSLSMNPQDPNAGGNQRKNLFQSLNASLKRLQTDYVDILWVHQLDFLTSVEETLRGLDDIVSTGKVHYIAISNAPAWIISQANTLADIRGWTRFNGIQVRYNLAQRDVERDLLPMAKKFDLTVTAWAPLCGGVLTGKYSKQSNGIKRLGPDNPWSKMVLNDWTLSIARKFESLVKDWEGTYAQIALNWLRQQTNKVAVIPIIGARTSEQITENLNCLNFSLTATQLRELDKISKTPRGYPHDYLDDIKVKKLVYGDNIDKIVR